MSDELHEVFWQHQGDLMNSLGYSKSGEAVFPITDSRSTPQKNVNPVSAQVESVATVSGVQPSLPVIPSINQGELQLFHDYSGIDMLSQLPEVAGFYALLNRMRTAVREKDLAWVDYEELVLYASVCFWMIRKLEYGFAARAFTQIQKGNAPLKVLDVGCGVVPLCNWMAQQSHQVTAIDPVQAHMEFAQRHLNDFYGTEITYDTIRSEQLPYPDTSFDVVTCISVLEHIPPGNDALALLEIARVLKPDGHLILTFDVSPETPLLAGEKALETNQRRFRYPFTQAAAQQLFERLHSLFNFVPQTITDSLNSLTWEHVHQFWSRTRHHDGRTEPLREYLAAGIVMQRTHVKTSESPAAVATALLHGQAAIEQQSDFFEHHAGVRLQVINQLAEETARLQRALSEEKDRPVTTALDESGKTKPTGLPENALAELIIETRNNRKQFEKLLAVRQTTEAKIEQYNDEKKALEAEANVAQLKLAETQAALTANNQYIERLQHEISIERQRSAIQGKEWAQQMRAHQETLATLQQENQTIHLALAGKEAAFTETRNRLAYLQKEIEEAKQAAAARETASQHLVTKLNQQVHDLRKETGKLNQELAKSQAATNTAHSLSEAFQRTIQEQARTFEMQQEAHSRAFENMNLIADARLRVIEEQQAALQAYRRWSLKGRVKNFLAPQLGVLYQHPPQPMEIPAKYLKTSPPRKAPSISIVTPSYNQGGFIERTIQSVLSQEYPDLEYIIQDGASKDETMQVVEKYAGQLKHYESVRDNGQTHALNLGFRHAEGEIMAYLNSDDLLLPGALNYVGDYFAKHPNVDVVYGHRIIVDEYDQEVGRWVMPPHDNKALSWADYIPQETLFWRRSAWEKAGGTMDESFRFAMDWDLLLRLRDAGVRMRRLPRFLGAFRIHPHQKTSAQISDIGNQEMTRLRERCAGRAVSPDEIRSQLRPYLIKHILVRRLRLDNFL
ncbi:MAG: glycosyltransferase [Acidobacteria bacterium]|nr:glycosyltransferase [Acidobacteriota bacterium]